MNWINILGLIIVILMLVPNMVYAHRNKNIKNKCTSRLMNIVEQIGRYGSMLLMVFNIGISEFGFQSMAAFLIWLICIPVLLVLYWIVWGFYFKEPTIHFAMPLAIIPSIIFILSGVTLMHWLLVMFGILFSIGHIYVTFQNNHAEESFPCGRVWGRIFRFAQNDRRGRLADGDYEHNPHKKA